MTVPIARILIAWPLLVAEIAIFGTAAFCLAVVPPTEDRGHVVRAFRSVWRVLSVVATMLSPIALLADTADMAGRPLGAAFPFLPTVVSDTHFGHVWSWSFPASIALAIVAWLPSRGNTTTVLLCGFAGLTLLGGSLTSHAIDHGAAAVAAYLIHQVAAALWIGALVGLWVGAFRCRLGSTWVQRIAPRVSRLAGWCVIVLLLSGVYSADAALGLDPGRLVSTAYGRILLAKLAVAIPVLLMGAQNRYLLLASVGADASQRTLLRNVGSESALLIIVMGLASWLGNTPPAYHG